MLHLYMQAQKGRFYGEESSWIYIFYLSIMILIIYLNEAENLLPSIPWNSHKSVFISIFYYAQSHCFTDKMPNSLIKILD